MLLWTRWNETEWSIWTASTNHAHYLCTLTFFLIHGCGYCSCCFSHRDRVAFWQLGDRGCYSSHAGFSTWYYYSIYIEMWESFYSSNWRCNHLFLLLQISKVIGVYVVTDYRLYCTLQINKNVWFLLEENSVPESLWTLSPTPNIWVLHMPYTNRVITIIKMQSIDDGPLIIITIIIHICRLYITLYPCLPCRY